MHVGTVLSVLAEDDPDAPLVTVGPTTLTRAELNARANRLARAYAQRGLGHHDHVAISLPNGLGFLTALHAVWKLGAVPVPISPKLTRHERDQLHDLIRPALVVDTVPASTEHSADELPEPPPMDYWKMSTSGGSTGQPKLIVPAQTSDLSIGAVSTLRMRPGQRQLVVGPLYHASPFNWSTFGSMTGQHLVVMEKFDAVGALELIAHHRISWVCLVPTMMHRILREIDAAPGRYDVSSLETVWHMAAPCPEWLKRRWIDVVGADRLMELYGTTEGLALTSISGAEWLERPGSVGRPFQGEIKVVDDSGADAAPDVDGLVYMRNPAAARTYRYVGAQASSIEGGWQTMGDRGRTDADGFLYLADRVSDMVLVGGTNVYPAETEAAILQYPGVLSCAVVGLPDADLGQRLHAVVETSAPDRDEAALSAFLRERLTGIKVPRSFRFVDHPLRDDAGKVRRGVILQQELALRAAS